MEVVWLVLILAALIVGLVVSRLFSSVTVFEYQRGIEYRGGRFGRVLEPGRFWIFAPTTQIVKVDVRPSFITVPGQEVVSADGVTVKISLAARYRIADVRTALLEVDSYDQALYLTLQLSLREVAGTRRIEEILEDRSRIGQEVLERSKEAVAGFGLELMLVEVRDVMFAGDTKKIFAQVVQAQKEGQAALERARGETAALRNLANAARLVESNPALMQLRALQQLGGSPGSTLILGMPPTSTPIPVREQPAAGDSTKRLPEPTEEPS